MAPQDGCGCRERYAAKVAWAHERKKLARFTARLLWRSAPATPSSMTPNNSPVLPQSIEPSRRLGPNVRRWWTQVKSRCGAVAVGRTYLLPPLSSGGALVVRPWLRFHISLIEPDMQISRIRLSDKTSRLHPRHVVPKPAQAYEPEVPVKVLEWISSALASPDLVLEAQPPAQPHSGVVVDRPIRFGDGAYFEVVRPSA